MAFIKYKELTNYFNFRKKLDETNLAKFVTDYIFDDEKILAAYATRRDHGIFTDKKIILFDNDSGLFISKEIFTIPYSEISTIAIKFKTMSANIMMYMDSGYPIKLKFVNLRPDDKRDLRILYTQISKQIVEKYKKR